MTPPFDWATLLREPMPEGQHPKTPPSFGVPCADGTVLQLETLQQSYLYAGDLLGGLRHPEEYLRRVVEEARTRHRWVEAEPIVLPPVLLEFSRPAPPGATVATVTGVTLPRVATIALFTCGKPARDPSETFSSLVVIWFQERFGNPEAETVTQIASLDWKALAFDWTP